MILQSDWPSGIDVSPVAARFGRKLAMFLIISVCQIGIGHPSSLFELSGLSKALCLALALGRGEWPFGRSFTDWDEAGWFGLVAAWDESSGTGSRPDLASPPEDTVTS